MSERVSECFIRGSTIICGSYCLATIDKSKLRKQCAESRGSFALVHRLLIHFFFLFSVLILVTVRPFSFPAALMPPPHLFYFLLWLSSPPRSPPPSAFLSSSSSFLVPILLVPPKKRTRGSKPEDKAESRAQSKT